MIIPHGGALVDLHAGDDRAQMLKQQALSMKSVTLNKRQMGDLELMLSGAYSPLCGFMNEQEYRSVLNEMKLPDGLLWSIPIVLDIDESLANSLSSDELLGLADEEGFLLAILKVEDIWRVDKTLEAEKVYGSQDADHPGIRYLEQEVKAFYVGGAVTGIHAPVHYDFEPLRDSPGDLRSFFEKMGWSNVVAFNTGKPMHRVHHEITSAVSREIGANLLIHPLVGTGKPGDLEYFSRVHCYQAILKYYPSHSVRLSLLPYSTRMAGPREAIHSAIVRQNYGCSHIMIGPEHGSPPQTRQGGKRFYDRYLAQEMIQDCKDQLQIEPVAVKETCYVTSRKQFLLQSEAEITGDKPEFFSDRELKACLLAGNEVPSWFSYPEVIDELKKVYKPKHKTGLTLFFTGLSGSGKSTLARLIYARFIEDGRRPATLLDGDIVRAHLSSELGFSREHREINVKRIGFVAAEINKNGGAAICAPIAPYNDVREYVRAINSHYGVFIEIHVSTPLEVCEQRDRKGLYARARKGEIKQFTGISDPYEVPANPEIRIDTSRLSPMEAAQSIMLYLENEGYVVY